jgi:hypothetical protein
MTFEEFFRKKRISLAALEQAEPALFSEFKVHFEKMGEISFDHTKKYWFNKLRLRFPAPAEVKTEKVHIENTLAEQTIIETLTEAPPVPIAGFKPRFKAGVTKPADSAASPEAAPEKSAENAAAAQSAAAPALGFKPKFKAGVSGQSTPAKDAPPSNPEEKPAENSQPSASAGAIGFKPRFKAGVTGPAGPKKDSGTVQSEEKKEAESSEPSPAKPSLGFKPKFKAGHTKTRPPAASGEKEEGTGQEDKSE